LVSDFGKEPVSAGGRTRKGEKKRRPGRTKAESAEGEAQAQQRSKGGGGGTGAVSLMKTRVSRREGQSKIKNKCPTISSTEERERGTARKHTFDYRETAAARKGKHRSRNTDQLPYTPNYIGRRE